MPDAIQLHARESSRRLSRVPDAVPGDVEREVEVRCGALEPAPATYLTVKAPARSEKRAHAAPAVVRTPLP